MTYQAQLTEEALFDLELLSSSVQNRILRKIAWLSANFNELTPLPLTGHLSGLFKLRVGDYRVIYFFDKELEQITVQQIGHRKDIYD